MAPVLSASAWVMLARGVVGARIDTSKESRPTPRRLSQSTCTRWSTYSVMLMRTMLGSTSLSAATYPRGSPALTPARPSACARLR